MENDLLFTLATKEEWKEYSSKGKYEPESLNENGYIRSYQHDQVEEAANKLYADTDQVFLIVIDPLRIQVPMKTEKEEDSTYLNIYGAFSIDAVIDRILLKRDPKKGYTVRIKHFD